ncbi:MAG: hypothetical protein E7478_09400 [Ruminococcaceae bacterium]|nr:hypothetical protein [Oscillospiraceae bacterium]
MNRLFKRVASAATAIAVSVSMLSLPSFAEEAKGDPHYGFIPVSTFEELTAAFSAKGAAKAKIYLTNDIVIDEELLGDDRVGASNFEGVLDGNGFSITNVKKELFWNIGGATIKNLTVEASIDYIKNKSRESVFSADVVLDADETLTFENVYVTGYITTESSQGAGGFIGEVSGGENVIFRDCYTDVKITGNIATGCRLGGFVKGITGNVVFEDCVSAATFVSEKADSRTRAGGFAGFIGTTSGKGVGTVTIKDCYSTATAKLDNTKKGKTDTGTFGSFAGSTANNKSFGYKYVIDNAAGLTDFAGKQEKTDLSCAAFSESEINSASAYGGLDFNGAWFIDDILTKGVPMLRMSSMCERVIADKHDAEPFKKAFTVKLDTITNGAKIYYTTDGTTPTTKSKLYKKAFKITQNTTVSAIAVRSDGKLLDSEVTVYNFKVRAASAKSTVKAGTYSKTQKVILSTTTPNAKIYYTTNGNTPTTKSKLYTKPITVSKNMTIKTLVVADDFENSPVSTYKYKIRVASPTANLKSGTYEGTQTFKLTTKVKDAQIYYTTNGANPTAKKINLYNSDKPLVLTQGTYTIKVMTVKSGMTNSKIVTYNITIN